MKFEKSSRDFYTQFAKEGLSKVVIVDDILPWIHLVFLNLNSFQAVLFFASFFKECIRMYHSFLRSFECSDLCASEN